MFREQEGTKLFERDRLSDALVNFDEVNMDVQKGYGAKYTSGDLSSANPLISVAAPKPLTSHMDSRYVLPTKITSFAFKCDDLTI